MDIYYSFIFFRLVMMGISRNNEPIIKFEVNQLVVYYYEFQSDESQFKGGEKKLVWMTLDRRNSFV